MHKRTWWLVGALVAVLAHAAPPPADVAAIMAKLKAGGRVTAAEQERLRTWSLGSKPDSLEPSTGTPPDISAIMSRAQQGVPPTQAEVAKLKAWAEQQKGQVPQVEARLPELDANKSVGRGPLKDSPFLEGDLTWKQEVATRTPCDAPSPRFATGNQVLSATFHVRFSTVVGSKPIDFLAHPPDQGPWRLRLEPLAASTISSSTTGMDCDGKGVSGSQSELGMMLMTELAFGEGKRSYINALLLKPSPDAVLPETPWGRALPVAMPANVLAEGRGATFRIDAEAIRKALSSRNLIGQSGTYSSEIVADGASQKTTTTFTFTVPPRQSKLTVSYVDDQGVGSVDAWKKWLPRLWTESSDDAKLFDVKPKDDAVRAHVMFKLAEGEKCRLKVELKKVSRYQGIAGNYPLNGAYDFDLKLLEPKQNGPHWKLGDQGQSATLEQSVDSAQIDVVALDAAAYGQVWASCVDEPDVKAAEPVLSTEYLVLPYDQNDNKLADQWEEAEHVLGEHQDGRDDKDDVPDALLHHKGDGLALFEEYRGFIVRSPLQSDADAKHKRLSAHVMNVLVSDQTTDERSKRALVDGWPLFMAATGLRIDVVPKAFLKMLATHKHPSWVNFNTPPEMDAKHHPTFGTADPAAAAIPFVDDNFFPRPDGVYATTKEADGTAGASQMPRAPIDVEAVEMFPDHGTQIAAEARTWEVGPASMKYLKARKLPVDLARQSMKVHEKPALYGQLVLATMHEFVHAFGVFHHTFAGSSYDEANNSGSVTCPTRYIDNDPRWKWATYTAEWSPSKGAWVPPSFRNGYDVYWPYDDAKGKPPQPFVDARDADVSAPPDDWHRPWKFCDKCLSKMHLWAKDGDKFPEQDPIEHLINQ